MVTYSQIITALKNLVTPVANVQAVYDYMPVMVTKYPYVVIMPQSHTEEYMTLRDTKREYVITIAVIANIEATKEASQATVRDIVDAIIAVVGSQTNIQLGGIVDQSRLTGASFAFTGDPASRYSGVITYKCVAKYARE